MRVPLISRRCIRCECIHLIHFCLEMWRRRTAKKVVEHKLPSDSSINHLSFKIVFHRRDFHMRYVRARLSFAFAFSRSRIMSAWVARPLSIHSPNRVPYTHSYNTPTNLAPAERQTNANILNENKWNFKQKKKWCEWRMQKFHIRRVLFLVSPLPYVSFALMMCLHQSILVRGRARIHVNSAKIQYSGCVMCMQMRMGASRLMKMKMKRKKKKKKIEKIRSPFEFLSVRCKSFFFPLRYRA